MSNQLVHIEALLDRCTDRLFGRDGKYPASLRATTQYLRLVTQDDCTLSQAILTCLNEDHTTLHKLMQSSCPNNTLINKCIVDIINHLLLLHYTIYGATTNDPTNNDPHLHGSEEASQSDTARTCGEADGEGAVSTRSTTSPHSSPSRPEPPSGTTTPQPRPNMAPRPSGSANDVLGCPEAPSNQDYQDHEDHEDTY